jgi:TonB-dependent siderophore receptor
MLGLKTRTFRRKALVAALMGSTALMGMAAPAPAQTGDANAARQQTFNFDIAAKPLPQALTEFSAVAGLRVLYTAEEPFNAASPGLSGSFTAEQALSRLLSGTGITYRFTNPTTVTLEKVAAGGAMTLDPVTVVGKTPVPPQAEIGNLPPAYAGGQVARGSKLGVLGNRDIMDTPFNTVSYTSELMKNQESRTVADVLENDPSVRFTTPAGHVQEHYMIRGFDSSANDMSFNGLYGLLPPGHVPTEFLERVEVIKGPNTLLTGLSPIGSVGGLINVTPKRAGDKPVNAITVDYTSGSQYGTHADVGRRFGGNNQFGARFNGVYRDGETGVDDQSKKSQLAALALDYQGERLRLSLDAYANREDFKNGQPLDIQMATGVTTVPDAPDSGTNIFRGIYGQQENNAVMVRGEYDLTPNLTAYAALGGLDHRQNGFITSTHALTTQPNGVFETRTVYRRDRLDSVSSEAGLRGNFETWDVGHQVVVAYSWLNMTNGSNTSVRWGPFSSIYNPITPLLATPSAPAYTTDKNDLSSLALTDTLSFLDERVQVTLGVRHQTVNSKYYDASGVETSEYDKDVITPAVGVVVKPVQEVSLYANYIEGLTKGSQVTAIAATNRGTVFSPYVSKQAEAGVKWDAGKFANTLSFFQITKRSQTNFNNFYTEGEQRNRGIEWNVFGDVTPSIRALGGITYLNSEYTEHPNPAVQGKEAYGVPHWQGNLGLEWDPPVLAGLTLEGRAVYTGKQYVNSTNTLTIPEWWRFDVGARYTVPVRGTDVTIRSYVTNLLDKDYWAGSFSDGMVNLSEGRTFMLSTTVGF